MDVKGAIVKAAFNTENMPFHSKGKGGKANPQLLTGGCIGRKPRDKIAVTSFVADHDQHHMNTRFR